MADISIPFNISREEARELILKEHARGTDGRVIKLNNKYLLKLYHEMVNKIVYEDELLSEDNDIKLYNKDLVRLTKNTYPQAFKYYIKDSDNSFLALSSKDAISKAILKQGKVINTRLPLGAAFIDDKFAGCILQIQRGIQVHRFTRMSYDYKRKIMLKIIDNVEELLDNCIYHIDLDCSLYKSSFHEGKNVSHSHILVNPFTLDPSIIDLDGKSTIYTDSFNELFYRRSLSSLSRLVMEFFLEFDLDDYHDEREDITSELESIGLKMEYIDKFCDQILELEELKEIVKTYRKK